MKRFSLVLALALMLTGTMSTGTAQEDRPEGRPEGGQEGDRGPRGEGPGGPGQQGP